MRRSPIDHSRLDRANVVAATIMQILADRRLTPAEMRLRVAQNLRGEFDDLAATTMHDPLPRRVLPLRRTALTFDLVHKNRIVTVTAGYFSTGEIGEVFLATGKGGSDLASLVRDAAITLSLALQHGVKIETLQHAVLRDSRGEPLSLVGAVIDELARVRS